MNASRSCGSARRRVTLLSSSLTNVRRRFIALPTASSKSSLLNKGHNSNVTLASQVRSTPAGHVVRLLSTHERVEAESAAADTTKLIPQRLLVLPFTAADEGGVYRAADDFAARVVDEVLQPGEPGTSPDQGSRAMPTAYSRDAALLRLARGLTRVAEQQPGTWRSFSTTLTGHPPEPPTAHAPDLPLSACLSSPVAAFTGRSSSSTTTTTDQPVSFIFPGQGSQWPQMGQRLKATFPVFADSLRESEAVLAELQREHRLAGDGGGPWSLARELAAPEASTRLARGSAANAIYHVIMPVITALQMALVDLLADWGVRPAAVAGHSLGEVAAAYCSGALSRRAALRVVYFRGMSVFLPFSFSFLLAASAHQSITLHCCCELP